MPSWTPTRRHDGSIGSTESEKLIVSHLPIVRHLAWRMRNLTPACVDRDDLESAGRLGLVRAAQTWRPCSGVAFSYYCRFRIRGAMLDELRAMDPVKRRSRAIASKIRIPITVPLNEDVIEAGHESDHLTNHEFPDGLIRALDDRERKILHLRYTSGLQFSDIAPYLGLSSSRCSQIHTGLKEKALVWYQQNGVSARA